MPKRFGYLYEEIYSWKNLILAYHKARRSKRDKDEVAEFEFSLEKELLLIQESLRNKTFQFSGYNFFKIHEPKERLISCAPFRDRVVHHAICNILEPILDKSVISDSYACRRGKGLHRAVKRGFYFFRHSKYVYKLDIKKYFYTIDHEILLNKLERKIKDPNLIDLIKHLLKTYASDSDYYFPFDSDTIFEYGRKRGLPIGNLTSQIFANYYLSEFDHYMKEKMGCMYYIRYMDDILVFSDDKDFLQGIKEISKIKLEEYRLKINESKNQIVKTNQGVNFLGFRYKNDQIRIQNRNLVRFKRKLRNFSSRQTSISDMLLSINGHLGYFNSGNCKRIVQYISDEYQFFDGKKRYKLAL